MSRRNFDPSTNLETGKLAHLTEKVGLGVFGQFIYLNLQFMEKSDNANLCRYDLTLFPLEFPAEIYIGLEYNFATVLKH